MRNKQIYNITLKLFVDLLFLPQTELLTVLLYCLRMNALSF